MPDLDREPRSLAIAVLTFRRTQALQNLIPLLLAQAESVAVPSYILVVDNDPDGSAGPVVSRFASESVRYEHEAEPGIAAARNLALAAASETDLLVFIDDDEIPHEHWLANLMQTYQQYRSAGVVGNVLREYEIDPDPWIMAGRFFDRDPIKTGTPVPAAGTGNLLLDLNQIRKLGVTFDPVFGLSGGSDTLFTRQIVRRGGQLIWCAEAPIFEQIPASRLTRKWVLTRAFRIGNASSRTALVMADTAMERMRVRTMATLAGLARLGGGGLRYLRGKLTGSTASEARGLRTTARGAGMLSGAFGYHYDREYRNARRQAVSQGAA